MALIIEDGSIVANANSYATAPEFIQYCTARGYAIILDTETAEQMLIRAMDKLDEYRDRYKGYRTSSSQALNWPRRDVWDVTYPGSLEPYDSIPSELIKAQLAFAFEAIGNDLSPNRLPTDQGPVKKEKVEGAVEVEYHVISDKQRSFTPMFAKAEAHLSPLLKRNGLQLVRSL